LDPVPLLFICTPVAGAAASTPGLAFVGLAPQINQQGAGAMDAAY
jgi:hypothetical protein